MDFQVGVPIHFAEVSAVLEPAKFLHSTWLCAVGHCHVETGKGQTMATNLEVQCCFSHDHCYTFQQTQQDNLKQPVLLFRKNIIKTDFECHNEKL